MRMRRDMVRPEAASVPIPALGRPVDIAKAIACTIIAEHEDGSLSVSAAASAMQLEHSSASRLLAECQAEGLVERTTDPADRRRTVVTLTEQGREVVAEGTRIRTWVIGHVMADWSQQDMLRLAELLERFAADGQERIAEVVAHTRECLGHPM